MMIWLFRAELSWFWHETESKPASEALAPQKSVSAKTTSGVDSIDTQVNHAETQIDSSKVAVRTKPSHLAESAVAPINVPKARTSELADNILSGNKLGLDLPKPLPEIVTRLVDSMVAVPNGEFRLGSHYGRQNETPVISITVPGFSISSREATWDLVNACIRAEACDGQMQDKSAYLVPVTRIRFDTIKYQLLPWLNSLSDHSFALPSEVQWEYAAKAGSQADYYWGDEFKFDMANCTGCGANGGRMALAPVAQFAANPFGLFDMLGNAAEMVDTCWRERHDPGEAMLNGAAMACENIVVRGGGFSDQVSDIRTSSRQAFSTKRKSSAIGFRLIMLPTSNQN